MYAVCRWLLIGLLIIALPLKGLAAAGHLGCAGGHAEQARLDSPHAAAGMMADHQSHHHHAAADEPVAMDGAMKCTQCAPSCCAASAPPLALMRLPVAIGNAALKASVPQLELGGSAERLERPPRSIGL